MADKKYSVDAAASGPANLPREAGKDAGNFTMSANRINPSPELDAARTAVGRELQCSPTVTPMDAERLKSNLREAVAGLTRADGSPVYASADRAHAAADALYGQLLEKANTYNKSQESMLGAVTGANAARAAEKTEACAPVMKEREAARAEHVMSR